MAEQGQRSLSQRLQKLPPGRHVTPRDLVLHNQRERILLAVTDLAAERGYNRTTIESIAKTARVALVTFYEHFEGKEDCFLAAYDANVALAEELLAERVDGARPWPERVAAGLGAILELVEREPERARLCIVESHVAGRAALGRYEATLERLAPKLAEGRALSARGEAMPRGQEVAIAGGIAWLLHRRLLEGRTDGLARMLPEMLQVVLTPYLGESAAGLAADSARVGMAA